MAEEIKTEEKSAEVAMALEMAGRDLSTLSAEELVRTFKILSSLKGFSENSPESEALRKIQAFAIQKAQEVEQADIANTSMQNLSKKDAEWINGNFEILEACATKYNPFKGSGKGKDFVLDNPDNQEVLDFYVLLSQYQKKQAASLSETLGNVSFKKDMAELAINEAIAELSTHKGFGDLTPEEQKKLFTQTVTKNLEKGVISIIAADYAVKLQQFEGRDLSPEEKLQRDLLIGEQEDVINSYGRGKGVGLFRGTDIDTASTVLCLGSQRLNAYGAVLEQKTGVVGLVQRFKSFDQRMAAKYPKMWKMAKNAGVSMAVRAVAGPQGLAVLAVYKSAVTVRKSYQKFQTETGQTGVKSYLQYLKNNPKEIVSIATSAAGATISVAFGFQSPGVSEITENASGALEGIKASFTNPKMFARSMVAVGTGVANAGVAFMGISKGKSVKQAWKDAGKAFGASLAGVAAGAAISGAFAGYTNYVNEHSPQPITVLDNEQSAQAFPENEANSVENTNERHTNTGHVEHQSRQPSSTDHGSRTASSSAPRSSNAPVESSAPQSVAEEVEIPQGPSLDESSLTPDEKELLAELKSRFAESNPSTADADAKTLFIRYNSLMEEGNIESADRLLQNTHNKFEDLEQRGDKSAANEVDENDSKMVIRAKVESREDTNTYDSTVAKEEAARIKMESTQHLPLGDHERLAAEKEHADAYKDYIKAKHEMHQADDDRYKKDLKNDIHEDRKDLREIRRDERRLDRTERRLGRQEFEENPAPEEVNKYHPDINNARGYVRTADDNLDTREKVDRLTEKRDGLLEKRVSDEAVAEKTANLKERIAENKQDLREFRSGDNSKNPGYGKTDSYETSRLNEIDNRIAADKTGISKPTEQEGSPQENKKASAEKEDTAQENKKASAEKEDTAQESKKVSADLSYDNASWQSVQTHVASIAPTKDENGNFNWGGATSPDMGVAKKLALMEAKSLVANTNDYNMAMSRQSSGMPLSENEQRFVDRYNDSAKKLGLENKDGKLAPATERKANSEQFSSRSPKAGGNEP